MTVAIITENQYVNPSKTDWYIDQVMLEDRLLMDALNEFGYETLKVDWADKSFDWTTIHCAVFRSTWDYFHRFNEFCNWLEEVESKTMFINPISQIKWNMDKHYLQELLQKGIPIVESKFIEKGEKRSLRELHHSYGYTKTVIKPCVSGGGRHTYLLNNENYEEYDKVFAEVIANESMILQPFQENIVSKGEVSHIVIDGVYTHSILKKAKEGDYRVQDDFGGSVHDYEANTAEIEFAEKVAKVCSPLPAYARVDLIWDNNDELAVSEIELIEPELWFRNCNESANKLAASIHKKLS